MNYGIQMKWLNQKFKKKFFILFNNIQIIKNYIIYKMNFEEFKCSYSLNPWTSWFIGFLIIVVIYSILEIENSSYPIIGFTIIHLLILRGNQESCKIKRDKINRERERAEREKDRIADLESFLNQQRIIKKYETTQ